jgi:hypothetical protein
MTMHVGATDGGLTGAQAVPAATSGAERRLADAVEQARERNPDAAAGAAACAKLRAMPAHVRIYAVLDGARDTPAIYDWIQRSRLPAEPLMGKNIATPLLRVSAWLVELPRTSAHPRRLLEWTWGRGCGIYLTAPVDVPMRAVALSLKRILRVSLEDGRRVLFRYYDPRVLREFIPTCSGSQWEQVRGPMEAFLMESADPAELLRFADDKGQPACSIIRLVAPPAAGSTPAASEPSPD